MRGVAYVNDSKATNVASTIVALRAYAGGVHLIAGGRGKHQDFSAARAARRRALPRRVSDRRGGRRDRGRARAHAASRCTRLGDLEHARRAGRGAAANGEIVLLSPACASYDQYRDFEARGDHFRALVEAL